MEGEVKNYKVTSLKEIEKQVQVKWEEAKVYEVNAPGPGEPVQGKHFTTFPFPYMNGKLHLGHAFSLSKCEFGVRYHRLKGKRGLFPFGFHCTGMPIKACADKIKRELQQYGFPPEFPEEEMKEVEEKVEETKEIVPVDKSKGKKSKAAAKAGSALYQYEIMISLGVEPDDIKKMAEAEYWLEYFPPIAISDLKELGIHVDWRRSFLTTDVNPFFDSFVRWQFLKLQEEGKIKFGKRYTIFSPRDGQPCMDHDRSAGEGVGPQEYTLIKMKMLKPYPSKISKFENKNVFLVAATLRPETMYGQTNCWVQPDINYIGFGTQNGEIFVCTARAARNMSYQEFTKTNGTVDKLFELKGSDIIGAKVEAPLTSYKFVYILPMINIKEDKGTGIVTSVPSDSPDDYAALTDLKKKKPMREKYNLTDEMVLPFEPIEIIDVPDLGKLGAVKLYEDLKIQSQNDKEKLNQAKETIYLKGFYEGILLVGEHKGKLVKDVKKSIQKLLVDKQQAAIYYEPEKLIMSRSGEECVVALCDQWYLDYGEPEWKKQAELCLKNLNTYHDEVRKNFEATLAWLHEHACSRTYGLGTRLPWDESWLIESLSDSTIYNAYYTIAHFVQGNTLKGTDKNMLNIAAKDMTPEVWDYIFLNKGYPKNCKIKKESLDKMRNEFRYWYPVDLRCSGKDLIQNHLTYFLYCHTAMWPKNPEMWPRGVRANGHLLLNSAKMSKSEGNFLTLRESLIKYGADATRLALADAGDSVEDANFLESSADSGVLRLYTFIEWVKEILTNKVKLRSGEPNQYHDKVFLSEINLKIQETELHYENMNFKEALRTGVFELQKCRDKYREFTQKINMNEKLIREFIRVQGILISPICPHLAEHIFLSLNEKSLAVNAIWPKAGAIDYALIKSSEYLIETAHSFRIMLRNYKNFKKGKTVEIRKQPDIGIVWIAKTYPPWQASVLSTLKTMYESSKPNIPENKAISVELGKKGDLKKYMKRVMPFVQMTKEKVASLGIQVLNLNTEFNEKAVMTDNIDYLIETLNLQELIIRFTDESGAPEKIVEETTPGCPFLEFQEYSGPSLHCINPQPSSGRFQRDIHIRHGETVDNVARRLGGSRTGTEIWRFDDPELGPRQLHASPTCVKLDSMATFIIDSGTVKLQQTSGDIVDIGDTLKYIVQI